MVLPRFFGIFAFVSEILFALKRTFFWMQYDSLQFVLNITKQELFLLFEIRELARATHLNTHTNTKLNDPFKSHVNLS